jgi:ABC-type amino acid transport system permease subunit
MALRDTLLLTIVVTTTGVALAAGRYPDFGAFVAVVGLLLAAGAYAADGLRDVMTASDAPAERADGDRQPNRPET